MFKIGDFSSLTKVSIKALRHYDELGLLKPVKVDDFTGYRYYSSNQLPRLNKILALKDLGFSLNKIKEIIDYNHTSEFLSCMLDIRKEELIADIENSRKMLLKIESLINMINNDDNYYDSFKYNVTIKKTDPFKIACLRQIISSYKEQGLLWEELIKFLKNNSIKMLYPCVINYYDVGHKEFDVDIEVGIHVASTIPNNERIKFRDLEGYTEMACVIHKGSYETIASSYHVIMKWIEENDYKIIGNKRAILWKGAWTEKDSEEYITEIQIPVSKE